MLLRYPELQQQASQLSPEHFSAAYTQEIFRLLAEGSPPEDLREELDPNLRDEIDTLLEYPLPPANYREREKGLEDCIFRLRKRLNDLHQEALSEQFAAGALTLEEATGRAEELKAVRVAVDRRE